jgi:hypothetical protein
MRSRPNSHLLAALCWLVDYFFLLLCAFFHDPNDKVSWQRVV